MFEAFVAICILASAGAEPGQSCRTALLPGHAADSPAGCEATLPEKPPAWLVDGGAPYCAARPRSRLVFTEVAPGLFVHSGAIAEPDADNAGDVSNIAFVIGGRGIAVIDSGGSRQVGEQVYLAIRERSELPISHLVVTHMHPDHVFGAEVFREAGAEIVGQQNLPRALADRAGSYMTSFGRLIGAQAFLGSRIVAPERTVHDKESLDLGGRVLALQAWPTAHTATDLTVLDQGTNVLIAGDLLFDSHAPALDGSLKGWRSVLADLMRIRADRVVPGHGGPILPWPEGAEPLARYLGVLDADTRAALQAGLPLSAAARTIAKSEAGHWRLFDLYNARNATVAYTELEWE
ncbi:MULTISPECIES: quinoprotein relay system zinc metallohydrolase 2 [Alphaproteobacteria]|uniref:MBL fold metallo-hydrolase n=2 Tax=Alphaproteobacteria TaxID=28211 RepID=A0A512HPU0_9HYPH|nr:MULTISPECIES: quinoprotein relay system zinc metallohydrolase 2 [Alphaproteobacteria]GEO87474.1 MBL fold metallo-hydrolase [Ciceribacter naphthalenivorans]GLR23712.1 MBL fold metallo-hydrolase [Ciceribacter naphthalenivorans]GLT06568.1 MBL fold metallo-hydrolase [Sphingomonas psychrolutea]